MLALPDIFMGDHLTMSKLAMLIKTKTQPGQRDAVRALYEKMLAPRAAENKGQELVVFSYDPQDADVFYLFEIYSSKETLELSSQAPWFWEYMGAAGPLLDGQPEVVMLSPVWGKGVAV
jgi:quinol monooxygenase YgiN